MTDKFTPHRYQPEDWEETRVGNALKRYEAIKKMLRDAKHWDEAQVAALYAEVFIFTVKGLFESNLGSVGPNLNADYLYEVMDKTIWMSVLEHANDDQEMPFPTKSSAWTPMGIKLRPWSVQYGTYFHNRAFIDGEGGHVKEADGSVLKHEYILKPQVREAEIAHKHNLDEVETLKHELEAVKAEAEMSRRMYDETKLSNDNAYARLQRDLSQANAEIQRIGLICQDTEDNYQRVRTELETLARGMTRLNTARKDTNFPSQMG